LFIARVTGLAPMSEKEKGAADAGNDEQHAPQHRPAHRGSAICEHDAKLESNIGL
jgi:hypothetical protein